MLRDELVRKAAGALALPEARLVTLLGQVRRLTGPGSARETMGIREQTGRGAPRPVNGSRPATSRVGALVPGDVRVIARSGRGCARPDQSG